MRKRVLIYNWAQFDDSKNRGGGVSVYLRNLISSYIQADVEVIFVSSGCHYSLFRKDIFFEQTDNIFSKQGVTSYRIINSPIKAPAHDSFFQIENCLENQEIIEVFVNLLSEIGHVDEIHIHNIEGISTRLVETLSQETTSKIVAWFHNYHWFCPQIELFKNSKEKCVDYNSGYDCIGCLPQYSDVNKKISIHKLVSHLELNPIYNNFLGEKLEKAIRNFFLVLRSFFAGFNLMSENRNSKDDLSFSERTVINTKSIDELSLQAKSYQKWRELNTLRINNCVDVCVAVSGLVAEKITSLGVNKEKIIELPLGMDVYKPDFISLGRAKAESVSLPLKVGYVGYGVDAKGFSFFCDALESIDLSLGSIIELHIVAKLDESQKRNLVRLRQSLIVRHTEGYSRNELGELSSSLDIVVVPSLWWETYNQVAYEMIMHGVPVLVSDTVGIAKYLNSNYIFESANKQNLLEKLRSIAEDKSLLIKYWDEGLIKLPSMAEHFKQMNSEINNY